MKNIPDHIIKEIKGRINILDVAGRYVELKRRGNNYVGLCPFHEESNPSFTIPATKQFFKCFGCNVGGNVFKFLMQIEGISFVEAVKRLAEECGVELNFNALSFIGKRKSNKVDTSYDHVDIERAYKESLEFLPNSNFARWFFSITNTIDPLYHWGVGARPDGTTVFWYRDINGRLINGKEVFYLPNGHRDKDKGIRFLITGGRQCLFGEFQIPKYPVGTRIILVESEKTAIMASQRVPNLLWLATGGVNALTQEKAKVLAGRYVSVCIDSDIRGRENAERTISTLSKAGAKAEILDLFPERGDGYDLADYFSKLI